MKYLVTEEFKASENHIDVVEYRVGEYEDIPPVALQYGLKNGFVEDIEKESSSKTTKQPKASADK